MGSSRDYSLLAISSGWTTYLPMESELWAHRIVNRKRIECLRFDIVADRLFEECGRYGITVYLFGGQAGIAERAGANLVRAHPGLIIAGTHHGYVTSSTDGIECVAEAIRASGASLVCIGTGAPRQERWARSFRLICRTQHW